MKRFAQIIGIVLLSGFVSFAVVHFSEDGKTVVLLCHDKIWKLSDFKVDDFFSGKIESQSFNHESQKEGVCFKDNYSLLITEESDKNMHGNIYEFSFD